MTTFYYCFLNVPFFPFHLIWFSPQLLLDICRVITQETYFWGPFPLLHLLFIWTMNDECILGVIQLFLRSIFDLFIYFPPLARVNHKENKIITC